LLTGKAQSEMLGLDCDQDDVCACLSEVQLGDLCKDEPDRGVADKRVFVFKRLFNGEELYVKVSVRVKKDHELAVLSFHRKA